MLPWAPSCCSLLVLMRSSEPKASRPFALSMVWCEQQRDELLPRGSRVTRVAGLGQQLVTGGRSGMLARADRGRPQPPDCVLWLARSWLKPPFETQELELTRSLLNLQWPGLFRSIDDLASEQLEFSPSSWLPFRGSDRGGV